MARPIGITIVGVLVVLASIVAFLIGVAGILVGLAGFISPIIPAGDLILGGAFYIVLSVILGFSGRGLLRLRMWAWVLAVLVSLGVLAYSAWGIAQPGAASTGSIVAAAFSGLVFLYLLVVRRHFARPIPTAA